MPYQSFTDKVLRAWSGKGLFRLEEDNLHYLLRFSHATLDLIKIPKITEKMIDYNARFYYKNRIYNVDQFLALVINDRLKQMLGHRFHYNYLLLHDVTNVFNLNILVMPNTHNNFVKLHSRIRYVRDKKVSPRGEVIKLKAVGDGLQAVNRVLTPEEIAKFVQIMNPDPIGADKPAQGVLSKLNPGDKYYAPMFEIAPEGFKSIFPVKQNIVERFKAHITGDGYRWKKPEKDLLVDTPDIEPEMKNILVVFEKIDDDLNLIGGEIPISQRLAKEKIIIDRSYQLQGTHYIALPVGSVVEKGDVIAFDITGKPTLTWDMDEPGKIDDIVYRYPTGIAIKIGYESPLGVARVISRTGLKGVTMPKRSLGVVKINGEYLPVDAVAGPNSTKGGFNMIRLAWLALKLKLAGKSTNLPIDADINKLTKDIRKVEWHSPNGLKKVYCGIVPIMATTKVPEDPFGKTKVMTETLKFLKLHGQKELVNLLIEEGVDEDSRRMANEMIDILTDAPKDKPIIAKENLLKRIFSYEIIPFLRINTSKKLPSSLLLHPFNDGFVLRLNSFDAIMPSAALINHFTNQVGGLYVYPDFYMYAMRILFGLQRNHSEEQLRANYFKYLSSIAQLLLKRRGFITAITAPKVFGASLMQLPSSHVPRNHIVVIHKRFKEKLKKELKSDTFPDEIYDISVRNPVLWNAQLHVKRVWTVDQFKKHLKEKYNIPLGAVIIPELSDGVVLRNPWDMMNDQSDADGDELSIAIPTTYRTQEELKKLFKKQFPMSKPETEWIKKYMEGEKDNSKLEKVPFVLHEMDRSTFNEIMIQASASKNGIGQGTINLWKFTTLLELMLHKKRIEQDDIPILLFMYGKVVHDHIVRGIKHDSSSDSGYEIFLPDEVDNNRAAITSYWQKLHIPERYIKLFIAILKNSNSAIITAASRIVNGGNIKLMTGFLNKIKQNQSFSFLLAYQLINQEG